MFKEDWDTLDLNTTVAICSTRKECNEINEHSIRRVDECSCEYTATDTDHNGNPLCSADHERISRERLPEKLTLKLGARVILRRNINVDGGWVNGTLASVIAMHENCIVICKMNKPSDCYPVPRFKQKFEIPGWVLIQHLTNIVSTPTSLCSHCAQDARYDSVTNSCQTQRPVLCIWSGIRSTESCQAT